jgi:pilus assembly protein Flp/PilA
MFKYQHNNKKGAALVEYGVLVGLVAVVAIGAVTTLGEQVDGTFNDVTNSLETAIVTDTGGSPAVGGGAPVAGNGPTAPDSASCFQVPVGGGTIEGDQDQPGVFCFEFPGNTVNENNLGDDFVSVGTSADYVFLSGENGMLFESGSGDDTAYFNHGACRRNFIQMGGGSNQIVFQNRTASDAYFMTDPFGGFAIDFADGSGVIVEGNITQVHFTNGSLDAAQMAPRLGSDPAAPSNPACPSGPAFPGGMG